MPDGASRPRLIELEGSRNFRDLGGYVSACGRRVRYGQLFRSGTLAHLTADGQRSLAELGVRTICDLRTTGERLSEPTATMPRTVRTVAWDYELDRGAVIGAIIQADPQPAGVRAAIMEFYRTAPEDFAGRFAHIFRLLLDDGAPLALHCTAGKDRTGVAAALLLSALGVDRPQVIHDYALSSETDFSRIVGEGASWQFLQRLPAPVRAPLFAAEPAYIEASFAAIEHQHGSLERYLRERLNVDDDALAQLRHQYLTD
ncbi:MAG: tyrosine-protein phosphatase [Proteobacteria bacterium]|nr:tyrosine-protein phosphatase [Pseudomonadota bacterium]